MAFPVPLRILTFFLPWSAGLAAPASPTQSPPKDAFIETMGLHDLQLLSVAHELLVPPRDRMPSDLRKTMAAKLLVAMRTGAERGELVRRLTTAYEDDLTEDEMRELLQFFGSPLGRKFLSSRPRALRDVGLATYSWANDVAIRLGPPFEHFARGVFFHEKRDLNRAVAAFRHAVELDEGDADFHYALGRALADKGEHQGAADEFRRSTELEANRAEFHRELGVALYNLGAFDRAIDAYLRARSLDEADALTSINLGDAFFARGRFAEAAEAYNRAAEQEPDSLWMHTVLADAFTYTTDFPSLIRALEAFVERAPESAWGHLNLGLALSGNGRMEEAVAALRRSIAVQPLYAVAHHQLGDALGVKGDHVQAMAAYQKAIELRPNFALAYGGLGRALASLGRLDEAAAAFETSIGTADEDWIAAMSYGETAKVLTKQKRSPEAIDALRFAIGLNNNYFGYHEALGDALLEENRLDQAVVSYRRAIELRPQRPQPHHKLGVALERAGLAAEAQKEFQEAKRLGHR